MGRPRGAPVLAASDMAESLRKGPGRVGANPGRHALSAIDTSRQPDRGGAVMATRNVDNHRAGHEAFNRRDFAAMTEHYADGISWTDHAQGRTFGTPEEFRTDFLAGWLGVSSDIRITDARYLDAGRTVVSTFTVAGRQDGPLGPFP